MVGLSENAKAFRAGMEGLVRNHASSVRAVEQSWRDTAAAAENSAREQTEQAQKLLARVRERADSLQAERSGLQEISYQGEEEPEVDPEVEHFSRTLLAGREAQQAQSSAVPQSAAPPAPESAPGQPWQSRSGRFGGEEPQAAQPPQPPVRPARRSFDFDDDDFENQSWLR